MLRFTDIVALKTYDPYRYFLSRWRGEYGDGGLANRKCLELYLFHVKESPFLNREGTFVFC